ncbi:MAG: hypothetical protein GY861_26025 [bacterium]|nr:hypothetical protein [bacterium]
MDPVILSSPATEITSPVPATAGYEVDLTAAASVGKNRYVPLEEVPSKVGYGWTSDSSTASTGTAAYQPLFLYGLSSNKALTSSN